MPEVLPQPEYPEQPIETGGNEPSVESSEVEQSESAGKPTLEPKPGDTPGNGTGDKLKKPSVTSNDGASDGVEVGFKFGTVFGVIDGLGGLVALVVGATPLNEPEPRCRSLAAATP
ncbi:hypothetical protein [Corynebacterium sp. MSK204]|uniref:hypothetical protein n=1 Tax=Corynebacterium sp. MSK204 TaxID=3050217 RepID=UPI00254FCADE|nr:hypothetical protein [Corynebacterium sp. MSK204]MDK8659691.1 hypothetical protein [Corynebacterium sp. MSK204]